MRRRHGYCSEVTLFAPIFCSGSSVVRISIACQVDENIHHQRLWQVDRPYQTTWACMYSGRTNTVDNACSLGLNSRCQSLACQIYPVSSNNIGIDDTISYLCDHRSTRMSVHVFGTSCAAWEIPEAHQAYQSCPILTRPDTGQSNTGAAETFTGQTGASQQA